MTTTEPHEFTPLHDIEDPPHDVDERCEDCAVRWDDLPPLIDAHRREACRNADAALDLDYTSSDEDWDRACFNPHVHATPTAEPLPDGALIALANQDDAAGSPGLRTIPEEAVKQIRAALFATFGWRSRINPNRPAPVDPCGPWQTYDDLPQGILSGDIDHAAWREAAERFIAAFRAAPGERAEKEASE